jgi:hypothetical protein
MLSYLTTARQERRLQLHSPDESGGLDFDSLMTSEFALNGRQVYMMMELAPASFGPSGAPISLTGSFQVAPNVDAIQEFKVMPNTYDSSLGRTGGGSVEAPDTGTSPSSSATKSSTLTTHSSTRPGRRAASTSSISSPARSAAPAQELLD